MLHNHSSTAYSLVATHLLLQLTFCCKSPSIATHLLLQLTFCSDKSFVATQPSSCCNLHPSATPILLQSSATTHIQLHVLSCNAPMFQHIYTYGFCFHTPIFVTCFLLYPPAAIHSFQCAYCYNTPKMQHICHCNTSRHVATTDLQPHAFGCNTSMLKHISCYNLLLQNAFCCSLLLQHTS